MLHITAVYLRHNNCCMITSPITSVYLCHPLLRLFMSPIIAVYLFHPLLLYIYVTYNCCIFKTSSHKYPIFWPEAEYALVQHHGFTYRHFITKREFKRVCYCEIIYSIPLSCYIKY
jgi:hypothetical protein